MRLVCCLLLLASFTLPFSSCKKGCTNPHALNYDASAKEDDASCMSCDSVVVNNDSEYNYVYDYSSPSPHYSEAVLSATLNSGIYQFRGNACPNAANNLCSNFGSFLVGIEYADLLLTNIVGDTIVVTGHFSVTNQENFTTFDSTIYSITIPPYTSKTVAQKMYLGCMQTSFISNNFMFTSYNFQYK